MQDKNTHQEKWNRYACGQSLPIAYLVGMRGKIKSLPMIHRIVSTFIMCTIRKCRGSVPNHIGDHKGKMCPAPYHADQTKSTSTLCQYLLLHLFAERPQAQRQAERARHLPVGGKVAVVCRRGRDRGACSLQRMVRRHLLGFGFGASVRRA